MGSVVKGVTDTLGLTDSGAAEKAYGKAQGLTREQLRRLDAIDLPDIEKMKLLLESPELVGLLEAEELDKSAQEEISLDPALRDKQMQALASLQERADQGLTASDKYQMEQMLGDVASQEQSRQRALESQMAQRGMDSSGAALQAKLQGSQNAANQARQQAMQMAAQAQQNRQQALQALGQQAGQMESADYGRQSQLAQARDTIARYNAQNRQNVNQMNLAARQNIANQRANIANQQQTYNKGLYQQQFQNELAKAGAQNTATGNLAGMYAQQAQAQGAADANVMGTLGTLGAAAISDERVKVDVKEGDSAIEEMLDKVEPFEYNYKDEVISEPSMKGKQLGVMAQDLEQSPLGQEFVDEDENGMKRVNYGKMGSTQMAAISNLHDRIKVLEDLLKRKL